VVAGCVRAELAACDYRHLQKIWLRGGAMKKRWVYAIQIALLVVMISGLTMGCAGLSSVPTPPDSPYPADIGTYVIIAEKVVAEYPQTHKKTERTPLGNDRVWWIVEVSVKNKDYELPVTSVWDSSLSMPVGEEGWIWSLVIDGRVWAGAQDVRGIDNRLYSPESVSVSKGQTGSTIFLFEAPDINLDDAQICYRGQEPYSFGELSGDHRVEVYDWNLKKVVQEAKGKVPATKIATVLCIQTSMVHLDSLYVELQPTSSALADKIYVVDLYEKDHLRDSAQVSWNQPQLNVFKKKMVFFPLTTDEYRAYHLEDISHIFTVVVHE